MTQLTSFEETMSLLGALVIGALSYFILNRYFNAPAWAAVLIGLACAIGLALVTSSKLVLSDDEIIFQSAFREEHIALKDVERVGVTTFWAGLPGQIVMIRMRRPSPVNGYFFRIGILAWPDAQAWANAANSAVQGSGTNQN